MKKKYPWFDIAWEEEDIEAISKVIRRGTFWAAGPEIKQFESTLEKYFDMKHALVFNSGTSALHSLLISYNIKDSEIIVPSFSFISTVNCVVLAGGIPVFVDIEEETLGLDSKKVEEAITPSTKAILIMHYGGKVAKNILNIKKIAEKHKLILIEDNAESFGAKIDNKLLGTIGNSSILSFCQNKILPTGEGGAILTNNTEIYEKMKIIRSHGRVEENKVNYFENIDFLDYIDIGYNYRMPSIIAALGLSQMNRIDEIINQRQKIGNYYNKKLSEIPQISILKDPPNIQSVYQFYAFLVNDSVDQKPLQIYLKEKGIFTKIQFQPIHQKSSFRKFFEQSGKRLPVTEKVSKKIISIPFSMKFTAEDQDFIIKSIKEYFSYKKERSS